MAKSEAVKIIRRFVSALRREGFAVEKVVLYGSYAANRARPDSDIDVAIVSGDFGVDKVEEGMSLFRIAGKIDSRLEPVPISRQAFENDLWVPLIHEIRVNGINLKIA